MDKSQVILGNHPMNTQEMPVEGSFVRIGDEQFYKIANYGQMPDFFMTLVSDSDHWLFISSNGSLTAGRKDRNNALFPYYTDDKIHDYHGITGSRTLCLVEKEGKAYLWEPFCKSQAGLYETRRNLYKSVYGNKIIFEELNPELGVGFQYGWSFSDRFGFVKQSVITNLSDRQLKVEIFDGLRNILPTGVGYAFQNEYSNLSDAYKKAELDSETALGLFTMSSIPVDRAEPSESLYATTVWSRGLANSEVFISDQQLDRFRKGHSLQHAKDIRAERGAFFVHAEMDITPRSTQEWMTVAEINQSSADVANLHHLLSQKAGMQELVQEDIDRGTTNLISIVAGADGLQCSREELTAARHFSNTLFNVMRGGVYINNYTLDAADFRQFLAVHNKNLASDLQQVINSLPEQLTVFELMDRARKQNNADFTRLCYEYLPLTFSRRHGDPSRPWNQFSIENRNEDGSPKLDFQGNWRDIFQNWEALSLSYPGYVEHIISKFLNATTPDGYNPYRIMRNGIDWECPDPNDPWSYIGYWGDHQIIYLQKLLELSNAYHPGELDELLTKEIFAYANVPYRIKNYREIIRNPQDTIEFDHGLNDLISQKVEQMGADGRLLMRKDQEIYYVNLAEKVLVTLLAKLSNFIPEAGIWLNTQRPEWNDANNALVGNGVSMVTLYYLRRFLKFWEDRFTTSRVETVEVSEEVRELFDVVFKLFAEQQHLLENGFSGKERRAFTDVLGMAGSDYREKIYNHSFSGKKVEVTTEELAEFAGLALAYMDQSIRVNRRDDHLYHAYNLVSFSEKEIKIRYLYEMLEGQVAVLSSGYLSAEEGLDVLHALKGSSLFRQDQYSYILYPDRALPRFMEKNNIPARRIEETGLLKALINEGDSRIVVRDDRGNYHFNGMFRNAMLLSQALDELDGEKYGELASKDRQAVLKIYEEMFDHQSFTGRSGTFYGYEGLGSIYWHMVSKLLLAVEECYFRALDEEADPALTGQLKQHYYEIKAGIGLYKSPALYGAFPTDAYSHTPGNSGAKQPGMTGQVKEDIIARMGELGVRVSDGKIAFDTRLINHNEFAKEESVCRYLGIRGSSKQRELVPGQLGFTVCQTPVIYTAGDRYEIRITFSDGSQEHIAGQSLDQRLSSMIFDRTGEVEVIEVKVKP